MSLPSTRKYKQLFTVAESQSKHMQSLPTTIKMQTFTRHLHLHSQMSRPTGSQVYSITQVAKCPPTREYDAQNETDQPQQSSVANDDRSKVWHALSHAYWIVHDDLRLWKRVALPACQSIVYGHVLVSTQANVGELFVFTHNCCTAATNAIHSEVE